MVRTKVFVGNLSFSTKENELANEFAVAGKVISANIITRGPRSLGYGFVEMENEADANNAVTLLNKKEIDGRPINVEVAKVREEGTQDEQKGQQSTRGSGRGRGGRGRGGFGGRGRGGNATGANANATGGGFRKRFRRRDGSDDENGNEGGNEGGVEGGERRRGGRGGFRGRARGGQRRREEGSDENRAPSQTTLFVANLPFSLDDDGFSKLFKDGNLAFKSAHVVKKRTGRSKGFGFAEFENEGDQQKALTALNNKQVDGRELVVKVALTENKPATDAKAPETTANASTPKTEKQSTPQPEKKEEKAPTPKTDKK